MIDFPPITADGQIFQNNGAFWTSENSKQRWNILPSFLPTPLPIELGGTGATTASGARANLGIGGSSQNLTFATLPQVLSGLNTDLLISPTILTQTIVSPAFRFINPSTLAASNSGTNAISVVNVLGAQMNYPTVRGFAARIDGGNSQQMLQARNGGIDWTKTVMMTGRFRLGSNVNFPTSAHMTRFILGGGATNAVFGDWETGEYGIGLRINGLGPLELIMQNGPLTTFQSISANIFLATDFSCDFSIISRNGEVQLYFNNTFAVSSNAGPTINQGLARLKIVAETLSASRAVFMYFSGISIFTEPV